MSLGRKLTEDDIGKVFVNRKGHEAVLKAVKRGYASFEGVIPPCWLDGQYNKDNYNSPWDLVQCLDHKTDISTAAPKKYNDNKPMMSLIRPEFQLALAEALTYGYTKYEEQRGDLQNYLKGDGFHYSTIIDSLERHLNAFKSGINIDDESGLEHLALAAANIMFLHTYEQCERGIDDRIKLEDLDE